jgi:hypothetical protein
MSFYFVLQKIASFSKKCFIPLEISNRALFIKYYWTKAIKVSHLLVHAQISHSFSKGNACKLPQKSDFLPKVYAKQLRFIVGQNHIELVNGLLYKDSIVKEKLFHICQIFLRALDLFIFAHSFCVICVVIQQRAEANFIVFFIIIYWPTIKLVKTNFNRLYCTNTYVHFLKSLGILWLC